MRYIKPAVLATAALLLAGVLMGALAPPACADVSFEVSYSNLSRHGSWLVSTQYGRVWQPSIYTQEWNPYYDGHWVYTDMGWTWVSDYEWGSIPYHYGTWVSDSEAGWVWIPGSVWAPSWVVFRTDSDYIGWAPVPPGFSVGTSIDMGAPSTFIFVSSRDFLAPRIRMSIIPRERTSIFINNTTVVNNITIQNNVVINRGPDFKIVERATGRAIREERIENVARVAPFDHLSRAQLAADPEKVKRGVRAAEQVRADSPLPGSDKGEVRGRKDSPADESRSKKASQADRTNGREPAATPAAAMPRVAPRPAPKARRPQAAPRDAAEAPSSAAENGVRGKERSRPQPRSKAKSAATDKPARGDAPPSQPKADNPPRPPKPPRSNRAVRPPKAGSSHKPPMPDAPPTPPKTDKKDQKDQKDQKDEE